MSSYSPSIIFFIGSTFGICATFLTFLYFSTWKTRTLSIDKPMPPLSDDEEIPYHLKEHANTFKEIKECSGCQSYLTRYDYSETSHGMGGFKQICSKCGCKDFFKNKVARFDCKTRQWVEGV